MSEFQIVALVGLVAWLILAVGSLSRRELPLAKGLKLAFIWLGLFLIVTLFISTVTAR